MPELWDSWSQGYNVYVANPRFMRLMSAFWHKTAITSPPMERGHSRSFLWMVPPSKHTSKCALWTLWTHNVHNKPNDLRYVNTASISSSVSRTSIFGIIAIWSANNTFHILTRMSGHANQAIHIYWSSNHLPIDFFHTRPLYGPGTTADNTHVPMWTPGLFFNNFLAS